ncbi:Peptidyl-lysine N-acetyltransferase Pat [subsurface metagenome]
MGVYCPSSGLSFCVDFPRESGSVGFIAQSGGHSLYGTMQAITRGIRFSKVISYGNASNLDETDLLEYLTDDPETKIIAAYIEGVKNGQRFFKVLKRAAKLKPVIIFKGGTTEYGARTASSHTAAIAGSTGVWSSLIKQAGAIQAYSVDELFDMVALFYHMSPPNGRNVAVMGLGGGVSVMAADACASAGLAMPQFSPETSRKLRETDVTDAGKIFNNPVDIFAHGSSELIRHMVTTILDSGQIDLLMIHIAFDTYPVHDAMESKLYIEALTGFTREIKKHTIVVLYAIALPRSKNMAAEVQATLAEAGFSVFPSFTRAASAYAKFAQYHGR